MNQYEPISCRWWLVNLFTLAGFAIGIAGIYFQSNERVAAVMLFASLTIDGLDGKVARYLGVVSELGSNLDWHADVALAHIAVWRFNGELAPYASAFLVLAQSISRTSGTRVSGRTVVFVMSILMLMRRIWP